MAASSSWPAPGSAGSLASGSMPRAVASCATALQHRSCCNARTASIFIRCTLQCTGSKRGSASNTARFNHLRRQDILLECAFGLAIACIGKGRNNDAVQVLVGPIKMPAQSNRQRCGRAAAGATPVISGGVARWRLTASSCPSRVETSPLLLCTYTLHYPSVASGRRCTRPSGWFSPNGQFMLPT
jgi:hypothetical protein